MTNKFFKTLFIIIILSAVYYTADRIILSNDVKVKEKISFYRNQIFLGKEVKFEIIEYDSNSKFYTFFYDIKKKELDEVINFLKLPSSKKDYAINLALSKDLKDSIEIKPKDIFLVTIYTHLIFGYNKESVYHFKNNKWNYLKEESDIVRYYSSCSQNYWIANKFDSLNNKSEIRMNTFREINN